MPALRLDRDPWVPTRQGLLTLEAALQPGIVLAAGNARLHAALLRLLTVLHVRANGTLPEYLRRHAAGLRLFDPARPFLQLPPAATADLRLQPVSVMVLSRSSGRSSTLFSRDLDHDPKPLRPVEALHELVTYQQFAPSNGKSAWGHTLDAPLARGAAFFAEGPDLVASVALNAPAGPFSAPTWETPPDPAAWKVLARHDLDPNERFVQDSTRALAFPWLSLTLEPAEGVTHVRLAGGPVPDPRDDPHAHTFLRDGQAEFDAVKNPRVRAKNPADGCPERLLVRALLAALGGAAEHETLPVGFVRAAAQGGATHARVVVQQTQTGQPVIIDVLEAVLPWPSVNHTDAVALLSAVLTDVTAVEEALRRMYHPRLGSAARDAVYASGALRSVWRSVWPTLCQALIGARPAAEVSAVVWDVSQTTARRLSDTLPPGEHQGSGRALAFHHLKTLSGQPHVPVTDDSLPVPVRPADRPRRPATEGV